MDTTFWQDFTIADRFGIDAVKDTYKRAFDEWRHNYKYVTELSIVMNHKLWHHYHENNRNLALLYNDLWKEIHDWCLNNLTGEELRYYIEKTD